jgi:hypothetical protein
MLSFIAVTFLSFVIFESNHVPLKRQREYQNCTEVRGSILLPIEFNHTFIAVTIQKNKDVYMLLVLNTLQSDT